jgi:hypothetical protein
MRRVSTNINKTNNNLSPQLIEHEKKTEYMTLEIQVYYYREFEPRSCRGVLDTTLCDKVCQ